LGGITGCVAVPHKLLLLHGPGQHFAAASHKDSGSEKAQRMFGTLVV
jgi:hypothetical protein